MISRQIDLTINKMTKAQYNGISPVADEVYVITDEAGCVTSVNGIQPDSSGNVTISIPSAVTESTVAGWGFTKNVGTVTSVNGISPTNGNVVISIPQQVNADWNATSGVAEILNKPTIPTVNNGVLTITQSGVTLGTFGANQSRNSVIDIPSGGSSRNIGEIVASTIPLTDAGLHLLDGSLIQGDGIYADFVNYIAGLDLTANYFCTETEWQQSITDYGVCGKFVYTQPTYQLIDTASGTTGWFVHSLEVGSQVYATNGTPQITIASVSGNHITVTGTQAALFPNGFDRDTANDVVASVRLPKITGIVEGTTDLTALGDLVEAGLPNISGVLGPSRTLHTYSGTSVPISGAFKKTSISGTTVIGSSGSSADVYKYEIDASLSNSIYGNSTTVQPQTIKVLYYIVIATSTKTQIQVDIDEIATDLNGKADVDLSNVPTSKGILTESYVNGTSWYRVYSDGWCEQGGYQLTLSAANTMVKINLLKPYKDGNYTVVATNAGSSATNYYNVKVGSGAINETDGFYLALSSTSAAAWWQTSGYIR